MMDYRTFCMILGIMFWVLSAMGIVSLMAWVYCQVQYYKWDKEDRMKESIVDLIKEAIKEVHEAYKNYNPNEKDEQYEEWGEIDSEKTNLGGGN